jgi:hypothetical protein
VQLTPEMIKELSSDQIYKIYQMYVKVGGSSIIQQVWYKGAWYQSGSAAAGMLLAPVLQQPGPLVAVHGGWQMGAMLQGGWICLNSSK